MAATNGMHVQDLHAEQLLSYDTKCKAAFKCGSSIRSWFRKLVAATRALWVLQALTGHLIALAQIIAN